jgi:hypothetical protein
MTSWISKVFAVISPFAFLILLIWVFFSPHFSQVCQGSVDIISFSKEPAFCFYFINFSPYFYYFSTSACFGIWLFLFL